jgi:hypothetical protein
MEESVMEDPTERWAWWQSLLSTVADVFTRPGWVRVVPWVTGMGLGWEEHTITQILTALGLETRWRVLEPLAAYGAWDRAAGERQTLGLMEPERPARWGRYQPVAVDDTKLHRTSANVWGRCTFHESRARSPNRAETVRAHNWVVMGRVVPGRPWTYLPHAARLDFRQSQLPMGESVQTKTALAVELLPQADAASAAPILGVLDGASAVDTGVEPGLHPRAGQRRIEILTRLRVEARLYHAALPTRQGQGRRPLWGPRLAAPQHHVYWAASWQNGRAWGYGRMRPFQSKQVRCRWAVSGPQLPVHGVVVEMAGYQRPWFLVTSAVDWSAAQVVEAFAARFRQEDTFRDDNQRLGLEECRAWTTEPILRTFQGPLVALTLLRLLQERLTQGWEQGSWWFKPAWHRQKHHASLLDLRRLFWRHRTSCAHCLVHREEWEKVPRPLGLRQEATGKVA